MNRIDSNYFVNWIAGIIVDDWQYDFDHDCQSVGTLAENLYTYQYEAFDPDNAITFVLENHESIIECLEDMGYKALYSPDSYHSYCSYFKVWKEEE